MRKVIAAIAILASALMVLPSIAGQKQRGEFRPELKSPDEIVETAKAKGLSPIGDPARRGDYYVTKALNARGQEVRVTSDALYGNVLDIVPIRDVPDELPVLDRGPRIIQVPQPGESPRQIVTPGAVEEQAATNPSSDVAPSKPRASRQPRIAPRAKQIEEMVHVPPPPEPVAAPAEPRRTVLRSPVSSDGPSPIRPLPRWREIDDTRPVENSITNAPK